MFKKEIEMESKLFGIEAEIGMLRGSVDHLWGNLKLVADRLRILTESLNMEFVPEQNEVKRIEAHYKKKGK